MNSNSPLENPDTQAKPAKPVRFVHIHAEAVNERIREALGTKPASKNKAELPSAAHFFAGPTCIFFAR